MCCLKCGLNLTEVQKILEMQAESDPLLARFAAATGAGMEDARDETPAVNAKETPVVSIDEPSPVNSPEPGETEGIATPGYLTAVQLKEQGNEYYKQGKFLDAIDCYEKAIAIDQFYKDAWYNKSIALKKIEREDQAKVCWGIYQRLMALEKKGEGS